MTESNQPAILLVDSSTFSLEQAESDLRARYGAQYDLLRAAEGQQGLDSLRDLDRRRRPVALVFAAQGCSGMDAVEFLEKSAEIAPTARRVLMVEPGNMDLVVQAIHRARLDNYLFGPWQQAEQAFFPVLDHLLEEWQVGKAQPFEGVRMVGYRWSARSHELRNFLARNLIPYEWIELETSPQARRMVDEAGIAPRELPAVFFQDGSVLRRPEAEQVAEKVGLRQQAEQPFYDLVVVGGGPAGLSASVYAASEGLRTLLIESEAPGGQAGASARIDNYLGFPSGLSGVELARRAVAQAQRFGVEILTPQEASSARLQGRYRLVKLADGSEVACHALLVAAGVSYRSLDLPGMESLMGSGVYYGAVITEAITCQDKEVYILGGGNSAGQAALYLTRFARRITMLTDMAGLEDTMSRYLIDQIEAAENISVRPTSTVSALVGQDHLEKLEVKNLKTEETETVEAAALFIFIGAIPRTDWLADLLLRDEQGYLLTGADLEGRQGEMLHWNLKRAPFFLETSVPGIFAAGDIRRGSVKRIASAVGDGAMAVSLVHQYLASL